MSSSSIGAYPHHSESRWPRISASSARRSTYSTSGVSETEMDAVVMLSILLALTAMSSLREAKRRSNPVLFGYGLPRGACHRAYISPHHEDEKSHVSDFFGHFVERRVAV